MKRYEKPCLTAISLSGNDQLCGTCQDMGGILIKDNLWIGEQILWATGAGDGDNIVEKSDFANVFGHEADCIGPGKVQVDTYCKFQSTGESIVAWS